MAEPNAEHHIKLNVLVEGDKPSTRIFIIKVSLDRKFAAVREVIQTAYWNREGISIHGLELYRANVSVEQAGQFRLCEEALLLPLKKVASVWPSKSDVDQDLVHIIVRPRTKGASGTRMSAAAPTTAPSVETELEQLTQEFTTTQLAVINGTSGISSSSAATPKIFRKQQLGDHYIKIGRPAEKVGLPIVLYHPVFGQFLRRIQSTEPLPSSFYYETRRHFLVSQDLYETEDERDNAILESLEALIGDTLRDISAGGVHADGATPGNKAPYVFLVGMTNEIGAGSSDPSVQAAQSYLSYWGDASARRLLNWCCCPSILVAIAGPWMCVLGAIFLERPVVQPLTPFLWIGEDPTRPSELDRIVRVFEGLRWAGEELQEYYRLSSPEGQNIARLFPYPTHYLDSEGQKIGFTYRKNLCSDDASKAVFLARTTDEKDPKLIVVKFVQRYNGEAHKLLAENGLAPKLLYDGTTSFQEQPSPEHAMVIMDWVQGKSFASLDIPYLSDSAFDDIEKAVKLLHEQDFVFGDLREPNIMVLHDSTGKATGRAMLIDFDWCSKHGEGRYPTQMNSEISWHPEVAPTAEMRKEHDSHMLARLRPL